MKINISHVVHRGRYTMQGIERFRKHFHIVEKSPLRTLQKIADKICHHTKDKYFSNVCIFVFDFGFNGRAICDYEN